MITLSGLLDSLSGRELFVARDQLEGRHEPGPRAGTWALEARRIAAGVPRIGLDTDHRTIPNEIGLLGVAVHLDKGCYRGQETVARVHTRKAAAPAGTAAPGRQRRCTASSWGGAGARWARRRFRRRLGTSPELGPIASV